MHFHAFVFELIASIKSCPVEQAFAYIWLAKRMDKGDVIQIENKTLNGKLDIRSNRKKMHRFKLVLLLCSHYQLFRSNKAPLIYHHATQNI